jgi:hypothetical protein
VIILVCHWVVSAIHASTTGRPIAHSRYWILDPSQRLTMLFTSIGVLMTLAIETYRVNVSNVYGVTVLAVPFLGMSSLAVLQWIILPPVILYLARRHLLGYRAE